MQYHFAFDEIITFYIFDYDTNSHINEIKYEMNENNSFIHFFFLVNFYQGCPRILRTTLVYHLYSNTTLIGI